MPTRSRRSAAETREHVLDTAAELFYWHGVNPTGVDTVAARADVAPTTLYRLFGSKDGLVLAYVERAAERYRERWRAAADHAGPDPVARILALFDALIVETDPEDCRGCLFLLAAGELPDPAHPAHDVVRAVKGWLRALLGELVAAAGHPVDRAADLALIVEGVYATVQSDRDNTSAHRARRLAATLLDR